MKVKKFLLFILIFLFFILLSTKVNAFTFTSQVDGKEYTVPDLETVGEDYVGYLDYGYVLQRWAKNRWALNILPNSQAFFYSPDNGTSVYSSEYVYRFNIDLTKHSSWSDVSVDTTAKGNWANKTVLYYGANLYSDEYKSSITYYYNMPYLANEAGSLAKGDDVLIFPGDFSNTMDIKFTIYQEETKTVEDLGEYISQTVIYTTTLNKDSSYYKEISEEDYFEFWYEIPVSEYKDLLTKDQQYLFNLYYECNNKQYSNDLYATWGGLTEEDIEKNEQLEATKAQTEIIKQQTEAINQQTEVIREQVETSKGILGKIGDILSYINPFSENFFVYKLIELLIDALKSLFIPKDGFFVNWISDLNDYFADRFGMLYYPFSLVIDFLGRVYNIGNSLGNGFVINFPDLKIFEATLIPAFSYDFAILLQNDTFANIYQIYLICVDVVLILGLLILIKNTFTDVFGGKYINDDLFDEHGPDDRYKRTKIGMRP